MHKFSLDCFRTPPPFWEETQIKAAFLSGRAPLIPHTSPTHPSPTSLCCSVCSVLYSRFLDTQCSPKRHKFCLVLCKYNCYFIFCRIVLVNLGVCAFLYTIGLIQVQEEGRTWFSEGWHGFSEGFPEGEAQRKS